MANMIYEDLIKSLFYSTTELPGMDMCGEDSRAAICTLSKRTDEDTYFELEGLVNAGFRENAFNGFCAGFQCAVLLLLENNNHLSK